MHQGLRWSKMVSVEFHFAQAKLGKQRGKRVMSKTCVVCYSGLSNLRNSVCRASSFEEWGMSGIVKVKCIFDKRWLEDYFNQVWFSWDVWNQIFQHSSQPRSQFSLLPVERPWLGLVICLPESGRLQTNDLGEGRISVRFVSTKHRRWGQRKLWGSQTSQDKTLNAESFDSESVTSCRISGFLSDVAKEITDSPLVQSKIF